MVNLKNLFHLSSALMIHLCSDMHSGCGYSKIQDFDLVFFYVVYNNSVDITIMQNFELDFFFPFYK